MCILILTMKKRRYPPSKSLRLEKATPLFRVCSKSDYTNKGCRPFFWIVHAVKVYIPKKSAPFCENFLMRWPPPPPSIVQIVTEVGEHYSSIWTPPPPLGVHLITKFSQKGALFFGIYTLTAWTIQKRGDILCWYNHFYCTHGRGASLFVKIL